MTLHTYLPQDRMRALARGESLPDRTTGSALFADISGFMSLTEALRDSLGPRRGAEELTTRLNAIYTDLIAEVEHYGGSVIDFAGDAIMCWFDEAHGRAASRAIACALAMQKAMDAFALIALPDGTVTSLALKVAVASGPARRFVVGDPAINYIDALAGATVARTSVEEHLAQKREVLADEATVHALGDALSIKEWRTSSEPELGGRFAVVDNYSTESIESTLKEVIEPPLGNELKTWLPDAVYERGQFGQESLLTEFRPCAALFVRFIGIDFDSDQAGTQLDTFIRLMQAKAERYEGTLLQITIGDKGSYAYINVGALNLHEDDCRRAVKLALALREAAQSLDFLAPLQIGITQGTLLVGALGSPTRKAFGALGDDVNLAARLMTTATPGEILISGRVRKSIGDEFIVEARLPMAIKGKAEPLAVFSVAGIQQVRAVRLQEPDYALPMIGRAKELELISQKLSWAMRGRGQIIGITGEAGMGKSRLLAEGIRLARRNKLIGYGGACLSDGVNTPYLVWNPIWNAFFDLDPTTPLRKQIRFIEDELEDRTPEHLDALPLLGPILGLPLPENDFTRSLQPKDRKTHLETVLVKYLEFSAREAFEDGGGLLLVLEDLHWIDPVSLDLLGLIVQAIENLPILILLTYRPPDVEIPNQSFGSLEGLSYFTEIKLSELNAEESEQAIRGKLSQLFPEQRGGVSPLLIERITQRAQGNPFYIEELLNYLHDRGIDPRDSGALNSLELPTSLHSLILSRIDHLTPSQQISLKVASIIGRVFRFEDLLMYYPWQSSPEKIKADLEVLARVELTPIESPEPELTYLFKHLVIHEVGYESIAYATRVQLHGMYARYLEQAYPDRIDQLASQLAYHFELAKIRDKAVFYLTKAGEQAAANYANDEALSYFNRTLKLMPDEKSRIYFDTLFKRERVYDLLGLRAEQRRDLEDLTRRANQFEDASNLRTRIFIRKAQLEIDVGDYAAAKANAQSAIGELNADARELDQPSGLMADALLLEARAMFLEGQAIAAKPQLENALALSRKNQYARGEYNALASLGLLNWYAGNNKTAIDLLKQSLDLIRRAGDIRRESDILNNLGIVTKDMYQFTDAIAYYRTAQNIAKKIGDRSGEASLLTNMGRACLVGCDYMEAEAFSSQAAALAAEVNEPTVRGLALHNRSEALRELGQYAAAKESAEEALALVQSSGYRVGEANALENIALIEFAQGDLSKAIEHAQAALSIVRDISSRRVEASVLTRIGLIRIKMDQLDEAEKALNEARVIELELNESIPAFEIQAALAEVTLARGSSKSLEAAMLQIKELAEEILHEPPTEQSHILPLGLYLTSVRLMQACSDPRTDKMIARAKDELMARRQRITDASLCSSYLNIREHRDIAELR